MACRRCSCWPTSLLSERASSVATAIRYCGGAQGEVRLHHFFLSFLVELEVELEASWRCRVSGRNQVNVTRAPRQALPLPHITTLRRLSDSNIRNFCNQHLPSTKTIPSAPTMSTSEQTVDLSVGNKPAEDVPLG